MATMAGLLSDMSLANGGVLDGANLNKGWANGPFVAMGRSNRGLATPSYWNPADGAIHYSPGTYRWDSFFPWWVAFRVQGDNLNSNVRIQMRLLNSQIQLESTGLWIEMGTTDDLSAGYYDSDIINYYGGADKRAALNPGGGLEFKMPQPPGTNCHGWASIPYLVTQHASDIRNVYCRVQARLVLDNLSGINDISSARIAFSMGADWYPYSRLEKSDYLPMTYGPGSGGSRFKMLTAQWQDFQYMPVLVPGGALGVEDAQDSVALRTVTETQALSEPPMLVDAPAPTPAPGITFEDKFTELSSTRWLDKLRWPRADFINGELQIYTSTAHSGINPFAILPTGGLQITADVAPSPANPALLGQPYTSGAISTYGLFQQQYGYFEADIETPLGNGLWPAFWLYPTTLPENGNEIDIMEGSGSRPGHFHFAAHMTNSVESGWVNIGGGQRHIFGVDWQSGYIRWYVDGVLVQETLNHTIHEPMYIIFTLSTGSNIPGWIPVPDQTTPFPSSMTVYVVRAYTEKPASAPAPVPTPVPTPVPGTPAVDSDNWVLLAPQVSVPSAQVAETAFAGDILTSSVNNTLVGAVAETANASDSYISSATGAVEARVIGSGLGSFLNTNMDLSTDTGISVIDKYALGITAPGTSIGSIKMYHIYVPDNVGYSRGDGGTVVYEIHADVGGSPSGTPLATTPDIIARTGDWEGNTWNKTIAQAKYGTGAVWTDYGETGTQLGFFRRINLTSALTTTPGTKYWIVVYQTNVDPLVHSISINSTRNRGVFMRDALDPAFDGTHDWRIKYLENGGGTWQDGSSGFQGRLGLFAVYGDVNFGQPHYQVSQTSDMQDPDSCRDIDGTKKVRQSWTPTQDETIEGFSLTAGRNFGSGNLFLQIMQGSTFLHTGVFQNNQFPLLPSSTDVITINDNVGYATITVPDIPVSSGQEIHFVLSTDPGTSYEITSGQDGSGGYFPSDLTTAFTGNMSFSDNNGVSWTESTINDIGFLVHVSGSGANLPGTSYYESILEASQAIDSYLVTAGGFNAPLEPEHEIDIRANHNGPWNATFVPGTGTDPLGRDWWTLTATGTGVLFHYASAATPTVPLDDYFIAAIVKSGVANTAMINASPSAVPPAALLTGTGSLLAGAGGVGVRFEGVFDGDNVYTMWLTKSAWTGANVYWQTTDAAGIENYQQAGESFHIGTFWVEAVNGRNEPSALHGAPTASTVSESVKASDSLTAIGGVEGGGPGGSGSPQFLSYKSFLDTYTSNPGGWFSRSSNRAPLANPADPNGLLMTVADGYNRYPNSVGTIIAFELTQENQYAQIAFNSCMEYINSGREETGDAFLDWYAGEYNPLGGGWNHDHYEFRSAAWIGRTLTALMNHGGTIATTQNMALLANFLRDHVWNKWLPGAPILPGPDIDTSISNLNTIGCGSLSRIVQFAVALDMYFGGTEYVSFINARWNLLNNMLDEHVSGGVQQNLRSRFVNYSDVTQDTSHASVVPEAYTHLYEQGYSIATLPRIHAMRRGLNEIIWDEAAQAFHGYTNGTGTPGGSLGANMGGWFALTRYDPDNVMRDKYVNWLNNTNPDWRTYEHGMWMLANLMHVV